jgi:hypothetical protein
MTGPILPGEHAPLIRALPCRQASQVELFPITSPALSDLAAMARLQGAQDAESPDQHDNSFL